MRRYRFLALAVLLASPSTSRSDSPPEPAKQWLDGIAAVVGSKIVTWSEVMDMMQIMERLPTAESATISPASAREALIENVIVEDEAKRQGIEVTEEEIDETVNAEAARNGASAQSFRRMVEMQGTKWDEYRGQLRQQLLRVRLIQRKLISNLYLSDTDLRGYYRRNEGKFRLPAKYYLFRVERRGPPVPSSPIADVSPCRGMGDPTSCLTQRIGASVAGNLAVVDFGWISPGELRLTYRLPLLETPVGGLTPEIPEDDVHVSWYVRDLLPSSAPNFDTVKPQVEEMARREELERRFRQWVEELLQKTFVRRTAIPPELGSGSAPVTAPVSGQP